MVANKDISQRPGILNSPTRSYVGAGNQPYTVADNIKSIVDKPRLATAKREMVTWRTPHLGYVQMYINPQNLDISDKKTINHVRTKAGFIIQYAGEDFTEISITGTTGSGGIEGINILEAIYRSEQEAFTSIAESLETQLNNVQILSFLKGPNSGGIQGIGDALKTFALQTAGEAFLNIYDQPFPTLASLAANVEMSFQGVVYRGYFKNFSVKESGQSPGVFSYTMNFTAYAKAGVRRNFMPWHRQPYNPASVDSNPLSFGSLRIPAGSRTNDPAQTPPSEGDRESVAETSEAVQFGRRDIHNAIDQRGSGISLNGLNLEDTEV